MVKTTKFISIRCPHAPLDTPINLWYHGIQEVSKMTRVQRQAVILLKLSRQEELDDDEREFVIELIKDNLELELAE